MKVHELLDAPGKWTQGVDARASDGRHVKEYADDACAWCLSGAVWRCYPNMTERLRVWTKLNLRIGYSTPLWNDQPLRTFDQVRALALELDI